MVSPIWVLTPPRKPARLNCRMESGMLSRALSLERSGDGKMPVGAGAAALGKVALFAVCGKASTEKACAEGVTAADARTFAFALAPGVKTSGTLTVVVLT